MTLKSEAKFQHRDGGDPHADAGLPVQPPQHDFVDSNPPLSEAVGLTGQDGIPLLQDATYA